MTSGDYKDNSFRNPPPGLELVRSSGFCSEYENAFSETPTFTTVKSG